MAIIFTSPRAICLVCHLEIRGITYALAPTRWRLELPPPPGSKNFNHGQHVPARVGQRVKGRVLVEREPDDSYEARCRLCGSYLNSIGSGHGRRYYDSIGSLDCPCRKYADHDPSLLTA